MKRLILLSWLFIVAVAWTDVISSDDFSGGTIGNELDGIAVQAGSGIWTKSYSDGYTGSMAALVYSSEGVKVSSGTSGGNGAIQDSYSLYTNLQVSTVFRVGSGKINNPQVLIGFFGTINKSYLANIVDDDIVACRFLTDGANEGKIIWQIIDEGVSQNSSYNGDAVSFSSNDMIRLTLSYNQQTGEVTAEAYNMTQDAVINSATTTVIGLGGLNYAGVGVSGLPVDASDPFYFDSVQVEGDARLLDGIIASDDFSDGTLGSELDGISVQEGCGNWTKSYSSGYTGNMGPLVFSAEGAGVPSGSSGGNAALLGDYSFSTNILQVSASFSVGSSKGNNPQVTVGFYETINKGYLQNIVSDDVLSFRLLTDGANEGRIVWKVIDEGVALYTAYDGDVVSFASNDVVRLTLSYNFQSGDIVAEVYNVSQDSIINTLEYNAVGLSGFNYAGMGVSGLIVDAEDPFCYSGFEVTADSGQVQATVPVLMISSGTSMIGVSATNLTVGAGWTNYLQVTENLSDANGWTNLYAITGVSETNWDFSYDKPSQFFRIITSE